MKTTKFLTLLCVITFAVTACDKKEYSTLNGSGEVENPNTLNSIQQMLIGTTWDLIESTYNGSKNLNHARLFFKNQNKIDFSNVYSESDKYTSANHISGECTWKTDGDDGLHIYTTPSTIYNSPFNDATTEGFCGALFGGRYTISYITNTEMKMYNSTYTRTYKKVSSSGGGSTSQRGVTDLYLYDYTEWPTKIKVIYKYESDVNVTSAKIYYGEYSASSSVSATVSSTTITATISGLKKNTVYYVKASATTSKGTVYSNESRISTAIE